MVPSTKGQSLRPASGIHSLQESEADKSCPLLSLPAEVRVHIYQILLNRHCPLPLYAPPSPLLNLMASRNGNPYKHPRTTDQQPLGLDLGILLICKKIHHEAIYVLYNENTFMLSPSADFNSVIPRLNQELRSMIRSVEITIEESVDMHSAGSVISAGGLRSCPNLEEFKIIANSGHQRRQLDGTLFPLNIIAAIAGASAPFFGPSVNMSLKVYDEFPHSASHMVSATRAALGRGHFRYRYSLEYDFQQFAMLPARTRVIVEGQTTP